MADPIPLYRFLDSDGALKTLVAGKFRVGLVSKFNDPFDQCLGFTGVATPEEQKFVENFQIEYLRYLESWSRVLCFCDSVSRPAPWSHYAEKHRGVAFEVKYPWPDDHLQKMTYFPERPVLNFNQWRQIRRDETATNHYLIELLKRLMINKSPGFSFEQEYRLQIGLEYCQHSDGHDEWRLPDKSLKRVILGYCCPLDETVVRKLLDMNGFTETEVVRAKMCQETYSIIV